MLHRRRGQLHDLRLSYVCRVDEVSLGPIDQHLFTPSRAGEHARRFLGAGKVTSVCDDFAGYKASFAQGVIEVGCMAHARRKFVELHLAKKSHIAATPLALIGQLYGIERELQEAPPATRLEQRQAQAAPIWPPGCMSGSSCTESKCLTGPPSPRPSTTA